MASANIFAAYAQPYKSVQDYRDENDARAMKQRENALASLLMQEKEAGLRSAAEDRSALQTLAGQYGNDAAGFEQALTTSGRSALMTQGQQMAKARADAEKARADAAKTDAETKAKKLETVRKLFTYSIQALQAANDPQTAEAVIAKGVQDGAWGMEQAQGLIAQMRSAPDFNAWRVGQLRAILDAEKQLPTIQTRNTGGTTDTLAIDPVTGQVRTANSVKNTPSPDALLSAGTAAARLKFDKEQAAAKANAPAAAPPGYRWKADGTGQEAIPGGPADIKAGEAGRKDAAEKQAVADKAEGAYRTISQMLNHPGLDTALGFSGQADPRNYVWGTDAQGARALIEQAQGQAFLQAFESLKGGGAITQIEGDKATAAIARLQRSQSEDDFKKAAKELRGIAARAYKKATGKELPDAAPQGDFDKPGQNKPSVSNW